tara:strand:+ start:1712 stop:2203 length:492 start_codon:yes stop_codon:yes gene_type:complete
MNIKSLENIKFDEVSKTYNIQDPSLFNNLSVELFTYEVQMGETMRPDLIMKSIYRNNIDILENWDVILHINGIENPLNVKEGMTLFYPNSSELDKFRYVIKGGELSNDEETTAEEISKVDKSTRKDNKREKFVKGNYKLPPVVSDKPKPSVRIEGGDITIGGF